MPLSTAVRIGADEGYEYAKAVLCLKGFHLYSQVWCDQPPLHTFWVAQVLKHLSPSVLGPRLVTSGFTLLLLSSLFTLSRRIHGLAVAACATAMLIASPGFLELGSSCMMEIPSLAPALAALALVVAGPTRPRGLLEVLAGVFMAVALQSKFIGLIYLPLVALALWLRCQTVSPQDPHPTRPAGQGSSRPAELAPSSGARLQLSVAWGQIVCSGAVLCVSLAVAFAAIHLLLGEREFLAQVGQSWTSHFAGTRSLDYGSPADRPFQWAVLVKNWDTTVPALVGAVLLLLQSRTNRWAWLPLTWTALMLIVFGRHTPWWVYYYVHNAIPFSWCAAFGLVSLWSLARRPRRRGWIVLLGTFVVAAALWMGARLYLQVRTVAESPRIHSTLVIGELKRYRPFTQFLYTEDPIYSFHADIPMPPQLAVASLKRFWSGDLTNNRLVEELRRTRPGVVLLANDARPRPFQDWLQADYRLVYEDARHRLYALRSVIDQVER